MKAINNLQLAEFIRRERGRRSWTQRDLARHSGVSYKTIGNVERCQHEPTVKMAQRIIKPFGVHLTIAYDSPNR